ncbi:MAG: ABC transporter substrate-binding protein [Hyphomicrobiaceae bacterium]
MSDISLNIACVLTDRTRPLFDGRVSIEGVHLNPVPGEPEDIFRRAVREATYELTEMSMSSHMLMTAQGRPHYTAIPVFLSRAFRHSGVFVRTDRGITRPEDLKGKRIGVPEYQQTAILWMRGILRDFHGIGVADASWHTGGVVTPGLGERLSLDLPSHISVTPVPAGETLDSMLARGDLDAVISTRVPTCVDDPAKPVARLFPDYRRVEADYHRQTGFFPIMHCLAIRNDVAAAYPDLPAKLFRACVAARNLAIAEIGLVNAFRLTLPWPMAVLDDVRRLMGEDFWSYGFARNREEIATMTRYSQEDCLTQRRVAPEELFEASTLELVA